MTTLAPGEVSTKKQWVFSASDQAPLFARPDPHLVSLVGSFFGALLKQETYLPHRNRYILFGFLWGIPIPLCTLLIGLLVNRQPLAWPEAAILIHRYPVYWFFLGHPLLFSIVFGAIGTMAAERDRQVSDLINRLESLANTDGLTGLLNHRAFQVRIRTEAERAERQKEPLSLLMIDVDFFKRFNDRHGHPAGDHLLTLLAECLRSAVRSYDVVCRYGGEEFAIILPRTDHAEAARIGERVVTTINSIAFNIQGLPPQGITVSVGLATRSEDQPIFDFISKTDRNLYVAKESGRNRLCA